MMCFFQREEAEMLRLYDDYLLSALIRQKAEQSLKRGETRINEEVSFPQRDVECS
jgi:hypothetical protein